MRVCDTVRAVVEWREKKLVIHANREANEGKEISAVRRRRRRRRQAIKAKEETRFFFSLDFDRLFPSPFTFINDY